ncbi:hypothetical protein AB1Y20_000241 [Prymnesium parvum]|uniref:Uncharacterized protein n=1 Tax=Prymnesium parvum TaxID=97485 RepID=A0AB34K7K0_PRYPA
MVLLQLQQLAMPIIPQHPASTSFLGFMLDRSSQPSARRALLQDPIFKLQCFKATADIVQVQTDAGMQEYRVPATHAQRDCASARLMRSKQRCKADEAALVAVLLNTPSGNEARTARCGSEWDKHRLDIGV